MVKKDSKHMKVMKKAARKACSILMANYRKIKARDICSKSVNDFVTFVDKKSQRAVLNVLTKAFPDYGYLAEEDGASKIRDRIWIIDPLDGTSNYIHEYPMFCVSIALVEKGKSIAGLVVDPLHKESFAAEAGKGATLNGRRIHVSRVKRIGDAFLATGFPFRVRKNFVAYQKSFEKVFYRSSGIRRGGSAALDLCYTASGRLDGFWEYGLSPWDVAAGSLIVEEAGGFVSDFKGGGSKVYSKSFAAGNKVVHSSLVKILKGISGFGEARSVS